VCVAHSERPGKYVVNLAHGWQSNPAYARTKGGYAYVG
jgi:hypothetical protein